jgi:hypothetical protein
MKMATTMVPGTRSDSGTGIVTTAVKTHQSMTAAGGVTALALPNCWVQIW